MAVFADPRRAFQHRALLDDRAAPDENGIADKRLADQFAEHGWLEAKLQVARDLFQRVPDILLVFEQFRMRRVLETEKFFGRKHRRELSAGAARHLLPVLRVSHFPAARAQFVAQFITFSPIFCKPCLHPRLRQLRNFRRQLCFAPAESASTLSIRVPPIQPGFALRRSQIAAIQRAVRFANRFEQKSERGGDVQIVIERFLELCRSGVNVALARPRSPAFSRSRRSQSSIRASDCRASSIPSQVKLSGAR